MYIPASMPEDNLIVACCKKKHVFKLTDVIRLEARSNYTIIYSLYHPPLTVARVLSDYALMLLARGFLRVHRSHLINRQHVQGVDYKGNIIMLDAAKVEVSRRRKKEVRQKLRTLS